MKKTINLLMLLLLYVVAASAQKYDVKCLRGDSVAVYDVVETIRSEDTYYSKGDKLVFYLHDGDQVEGVEKFYAKDIVDVGSSIGYAVILRDGKKYCTLSENLVFSKDNPEGVEDKVLTKLDELAHTIQGRIFNSIIPYIIIALLFLGVMVFNILAMRSNKIRSMAVIAIPVCIMLGTLIEIWAYSVLGSDCFWWCDKNRYGFFGSLLRIIPFGLIVFYQVMSIKFYEPVILGEAFDGDVHDGISVKPALISMLAAFPVLIASALICDFLGLGGWIESLLILFSFLVALGIGVFLSLKRNIELMKSKKLGILLTLFTIVYILGCIVAVWGLIIVIFKLIVQILIVGVIIGFVLYVMPEPKSGGGGNVTYRTVYYDEDRKAHDSGYARDKANEKIAEREAGKHN